MYHPEVIEWRRRQIEVAFAAALPDGLMETPVEEAHDLVQAIEGKFDQKGRQLQPFTDEERRFMVHETFLVKTDFAYWAERYCTVLVHGTHEGPLYPLWTSQRLIRKIAEIEYDLWKTGYPDGIFVQILKARQLGASTLSESLVAHRLTTHQAVSALISSDVPDSSARMFRMAERTIRNLPKFLQPPLTDDVKNAELAFGNGSRIEVGAGKSTRGIEGKRGQLGRSGTFAVVHLTELSTWDSAEQLDDALFPAIPFDPQVLVLLESTAKGRGNNWWHRTWQLALKGQGPQGHRLVPIFIPWYAEPEKYTLPAPSDWAPGDTTRAVAARATQFGPRWMGAPVALSRDQLYWYERARSNAEEKERANEPGALSKFLEEYPTDDEEAFQYSGRSIFPVMVRERVRQQARPLLTALEVIPSKDLAFTWSRRPGLYEDHLDIALARKGKSLEDWVTATAPPKYSPQIVAFDPKSDPIRLPPGMGFRPIDRSTIKEWRHLEDFMDVLLVWEAPRRGSGYVLGVDVASGVNQDRSVIDVLRIGTVKECSEQVAQFVSSSIEPGDLSYIADVVGRLYADREGTEALCAIECNGLGLQTQSEMLRHLGYTNFFVWQYEDAATAEGRYTRKYGWWTSVRTRPMVIGRFIKGIKTIDGVTGFSDLRVNSPHTIEELQDFHQPPDGAIWDACAAPGGHDDCVMAAAIAYHVSQTLEFEGGEPVADRRRRLVEEEIRAEQRALAEGTENVPRRGINTDITVAELEEGVGAHLDEDPLHIDDWDRFSVQ